MYFGSLCNWVLATVAVFILRLHRFLTETLKGGLFDSSWTILVNIKKASNHLSLFQIVRIHLPNCPMQEGNHWTF